MKSPTLEMLVAAFMPAPPARRLDALAALTGKAPEPRTAPAQAATDTAHTITAAARSAGYSTMTLRRAIADGTLRVVRPTGRRPRILQSELVRWMQA